MVWGGIKYVSFAEVMDLSSNLAKEIYNEIEGRDSKIFGLAKGGWIPAVFISRELGNRKLFSVGVRSYEGKTKGELDIYQVPKEKALETGEIAVLIDDIVDTGDTLATMKKEFEIQGYKVITAALHVKKHTSFQPDLYAVNNVIDWIVYPWEIQKKYDGVFESTSIKPAFE